MPFVSGTYQRFYGSTGWTDDKNAAVFILASRHDTHDQDIADGINTAVGKIRLGDTMILSSVSGTNTVLGALTPALSAYAYGLRVILTPANTNTGPTTLNVDSKGALAVLNPDGTACVGGELLAAVALELLLNSAANAWIIQSPANSQLLVRLANFPGNYTLVAADSGRQRVYSGAGGHTLTLPSSTLTLYSVVSIVAAGAAITISAAGTLTWLNGSGALPTGNRTLAIGGIATLHHVPDSTNWSIYGVGLS